MSGILVEQAVFSSSNRGSMKGYQLVAKSTGVDRETANELCRWAPTRMIDDDPDHWSINAFPISGERFAVTRTVLGGPEYSSRGAAQVVTRILLLRDSQFARYLHHPILVAKTAMAMGELRLPMDATEEKLPLVELPCEPLYRTPDLIKLRSAEENLIPLLDEVTELLRASRRVAVIGPHDPTQVAGTLISRLGSEQRARFSFTTGLTPAISRPFQVHFLKKADPPLRHTLSSQNIAVVETSG